MQEGSERGALYQFESGGRPESGDGDGTRWERANIRGPGGSGENRFMEEYEGEGELR